MFFQDYFSNFEPTRTGADEGNENIQKVLEDPILSPDSMV